MTMWRDTSSVACLFRPICFFRLLLHIFLKNALFVWLQSLSLLCNRNMNHALLQHSKRKIRQTHLLDVDPDPPLSRLTLLKRNPIPPLKSRLKSKI